MALALRAYEDGLCPGCGLHSSVVRGDHNVGRHEVVEDICHGCEALQAFQQDTNKDRYPGQKLGVQEVPQQ